MQIRRTAAPYFSPFKRIDVSGDGGLNRGHVGLPFFGVTQVGFLLRAQRSLVTSNAGLSHDPQGHWFRAPGSPAAERRDGAHGSAPHSP